MPHVWVELNGTTHEISQTDIVDAINHISMPKACDHGDLTSHIVKVLKCEILPIHYYLFYYRIAYTWPFCNFVRSNSDTYSRTVTNRTPIFSTGRSAVCVEWGQSTNTCFIDFLDEFLSKLRYERARGACYVLFLDISRVFDMVFFYIFLLKLQHIGN